MYISVFKNITIPRNKIEKSKFAKFSSNPYLPEKVTVDCDAEMLHSITQWGWSPFVFNSYRNKKSFVSTDFLVLDIDEGLSIDDCLIRVEELGLHCVCLPTTSHTKQLNKYRLVFIANKTISNVEVFKLNMANLYSLFPEADPSCISDYARFYFPCQMSDDGFIMSGKFINIVHPKPEKKKRKKNTGMTLVSAKKEDIMKIYADDREMIPECVDYFIKNASGGLPGEWIVTLNAFVFTLALQGLTYDSIISIVEMLSPSELDSRDMDTIDRAYSDGEEQREVPDESSNRLSN